MSKKRVLVTGSRGMLAGHVFPLLRDAGWEVVITDLMPAISDSRFAEFEYLPLDIANEKEVDLVIGQTKPDWIVNCAAYTAVDGAEAHYDTAFAVNAYGPANLARAARRRGSRLCHISTDYVFGRVAGDRKPVVEDAVAQPCGIYGHSKRFGEELVLSLLPEATLLVRTSWLHGLFGPNFVATILRAAKEKSELRVVDDQWGSPTWADWLAGVLVELIHRDAHGVFHAANRGDISWFQFAQEIVSQAGLTTRIVPQTTSELGRPAPRPVYSTLDVTKLERFLGRPSMSWRDGVGAHLAALQATEAKLAVAGT